jgi:AcrR family transcriptional regulator
MSRQKTRSEETKQAILAAAGELFAARGFDAVTMREIAKAAGCSHTAIYLYFADKEALLHQLALGPLGALRQQLTAVLQDPSRSPDAQLRAISRTFIQFCLANRTIYSTLFLARASRVDEAAPLLQIQQLRNELFGLLRQAVGAYLGPGLTDEQVLAYTRIFFFMLHGLISLYVHGEERFEQVMERLGPTFDLAVEVLLAGLKATTNETTMNGGDPR